MDHVAFFLQLCGEAERYGCGCERGVDAPFYRPKASRVLGDGTPLTWIPFCFFYRPKASRVLGDGTPLTWIPFCF
jgi:hypothetical protein